MSAPIGYRETTDPLPSVGDPSDRLALRFDPTRRIVLRFRLECETERDLDAIRYARRILIREERTRGLEWEEPSIEDAVFSASSVSWSTLASQAASCREKMARLVQRANVVREELDRTNPPPTR
ncbi:MAG TPA: hypothetical protein VFF17_08895 [Thermoanaerobaculia bacterium]|nr:hypothetical protein [Thermoanaerobaculia bacterium]